MEKIQIYVCPSGCEVPEDDFDDSVRAYECGACGSFVSDSKSCPDCHKFAAKVADHVCPECEEPWEDMPELEDRWASEDGTLFGTEDEVIVYDTPEAREEREALLAEGARQNRIMIDEILDRERSNAARWRASYEPFHPWVVEHLPKTAGHAEALLRNDSGVPTIMVSTSEVTPILLGEEMVDTLQYDFDDPEWGIAWGRRDAQAEQLREATWRLMDDERSWEEKILDHPQWDGSAHGMQPDYFIDFIERLIVHWGSR